MPGFPRGPKNRDFGFLCPQRPPPGGMLAECPSLLSPSQPSSWGSCKHPDMLSAATPSKDPQPGRVGAGCWHPPCQHQGPSAPPTLQQARAIHQHLDRARGRGSREPGLHKAGSDPAAASPFPRKPWEPFFEFLLILATPAPPPGTGLGSKILGLFTLQAGSFHSSAVRPRPKTGTGPQEAGQTPFH